VGIPFFFQDFLSIYSPVGQSNWPITDGKITDLDKKGALDATGCRTAYRFLKLVGGHAIFLEPVCRISCAAASREPVHDYIS
jgi:hypothetical protein